MHEVKYLRDQNGWRASNLLDSTQAREYMSVLVKEKGGKPIIHWIVEYKKGNIQ